MALTFTLNGQTFDGTPDAYGVRWYASVTGWDGPPLTANLTARPGDHGAFRGPSYYNTRPMTMAGHAQCPNLDEVRRAKDRLILLAPIGTDIELASVEDRTAIAQLAGALLMAAVNEQTLTFSIPLEAADPWKYGPEQTTTIPMTSGSDGLTSQLLFPLALYVQSGQTILNPGTQQVRPVVTYWGPCTAPYSTNTATGLTDAYDLNLPTAADFLVVDHDLGSALLGGTTPRRNTRLATGRPWVLEPESESTIVAGAVSSGAGAHIDVTWRPTYL